MKKKRTDGKKVAGWAVFLLVLVLIVLSAVKPEMVGSFLQVLGKGSGKIRLTSAAERFYDGLEPAIYSLFLPDGEDPTIITAAKSLGVDAIGIIAAIFLGSAISDVLGTGYGTGLFYAYLPCTAAVFLVNGVGPSNVYLTVSIFMLAIVGLSSAAKGR